MIKSILIYSLFALLLVALFLFSRGVTGSTDAYGLTYIQDFHINSLLANTTRRYNSWKFKIPDIPKVPSISKPDGKVKEIITALIWIVNMFIAILNFIISVVNFLIMFFNTIIALVQFVLSLIYSMKDWFNLFTATACPPVR